MKGTEEPHTRKAPAVIIDSKIEAPTFFTDDDIPDQYREDMPNPEGKAAALHEAAEKLAKEGVKDGHHLNVFIIGNGGTFQSEDTDEGLKPGGSLDTTIESLPIERQLSENFRLFTFELFNIDSSQMTVWHWRKLAQTIAYIEKSVPNSIEAYLATHGTDTMDDAGANLSYFLHQLKQLLIITGSQQPADQGGDAVENWKRCLKTILIAAKEQMKISERIILCGSTAIRATRAIKVSDHEEAYASFDGNPLIDFSKDTDYKRLKFSPYARISEPGIPFSPYLGPLADHPNIDEINMRGTDRKTFTDKLVKARAAQIRLMGSATAPNELSEELAIAHNAGKVSAMIPPFPKSKTEIGHYAAGKGLARVEIPYLSGTDAGIRAKFNYLFGLLGIEPEQSDNYGLVVTPNQRDLITMMMCIDLSGEFKKALN